MVQLNGFRPALPIFCLIYVAIHGDDQGSQRTSIFGIKITFFNFRGKLIHQMLLTLSIIHVSIFDAIYSFHY